MNAVAELHVIIGSGALGMGVGRELLVRRKRVRMVNRSGIADVPTRIYVFKGDVADPATLRESCEEATVVYHCARPDSREGDGRAERLMAGAIEAAARAGARIVYGECATFYRAGARPMTEEEAVPVAGGEACTRPAAMLMEAHAAGGVRAAIGRGSDLFGPWAGASLLGRQVFARAVAGHAVQLPGNPELAHTFTYVDDFARALVTLGERDEALGRVWHVPSAEPLSPRRFAELVFETLGTVPRITVPGRARLALHGLVDPAARVLRAATERFERPFVLDHGRYRAAFGGAFTSHPDAIRATLEWRRANPNAAPARA
ncbi:NAD dependent epimerase/dehydratase family protein [bacterium BMS3Bbin12]|nr:NAD dependent epimerase/dehydratase family protein [bacterium BMS3Bbin12]GBE50435.1 NAD dependent epimerase/dehydratase family protein [bacterium BMS3Bbin13]